jgi:hypothetical protein
VVVIAVEGKRPKGFGRVPFVGDAVAPGAVVPTDGWRGYDKLFDHGYTRHRAALSPSSDPAHVSMPGV